MSSWIVSLNSEFVDKYDITFNSFIIKAEEKEQFLIKMDKISIKIMELTNNELNDVYPFDYKEITEDVLKKYICIKK